MPSNRKERTSQALQKALLELLRDKPFEKITVEQVTAQAGYCKNTFYAYYPNMIALLQECYLSKFPAPPSDLPLPLSECASHDGDHPNAREALWRSIDNTATMLTVFKENPDLARAVIDQIGVSPYFSASFDDWVTWGVSTLAKGFKQPALDYLSFEECLHYNEGGAIAMCRHWFRSGMTGNIEHVAKSIAYYTMCLFLGCAGQAMSPEVLDWIDGWHWTGDNSNTR